MAGAIFISLPKETKNKTSLLNIKNNGQNCPLWSSLAHLHSAKTHSYRVASYQQYESELDMNGISYPAP